MIKWKNHKHTKARSKHNGKIWWCVLCTSNTVSCGRKDWQRKSQKSHRAVHPGKSSGADCAWSNKRSGAYDRFRAELCSGIRDENGGGAGSGSSRNERGRHDDVHGIQQSGPRCGSCRDNDQSTANAETQLGRGCPALSGRRFGGGAPDCNAGLSARVGIWNGTVTSRSHSPWSPFGPQHQTRRSTYPF